MNIVLQEPWTVERFLAWEDKQEGKHEFDGVRIIPMTGGARAHQRMVVNLINALDERMERSAFDAVQEMRVSTGGQVRYPDVSACRGLIPDRTRTIDDAIVVFEILSEETAATDKNEKRNDYARLPSIRHYVLLEQTHKAASALDFIGGQWQEADIIGDSIALPGIDIALPLDAIYRDRQR
jgi:Uma2 family endonuclease